MAMELLLPHGDYILVTNGDLDLPEDGVPMTASFHKDDETPTFEEGTLFESEDIEAIKDWILSVPMKAKADVYSPIDVRLQAHLAKVAEEVKKHHKKFAYEYPGIFCFYLEETLSLFAQPFFEDGESFIEIDNGSGNGPQTLCKFDFKPTFNVLFDAQLYLWSIRSALIDCKAPFQI